MSSLVVGGWTDAVLFWVGKLLLEQLLMILGEWTGWLLVCWLVASGWESDGLMAGRWACGWRLVVGGRLVWWVAACGRRLALSHQTAPQPD